MSELPAGALKRHPDWPAVCEIAMRTGFIDGQYPGWTSWIRVSPSGSVFANPADLADWPDATLTDTPDP